MSTLKYKEISRDSFEAQVVDLVVSNCPVICEGYITTKDSKGFDHVQGKSDTILCNLISTIWHGDRAYSRNELDRIIKIIAEDVHASVVVPMLEERQVLVRTEAGYILTPALQEYAAKMLDEANAVTPMVNHPMSVVKPWTNEEDGIHDDARMKLVSKSRGTQVSDLALAAVNKLQSTRFVISPYIAAVTGEYLALLHAELATEQRPNEIERIQAIIRNIKFTQWLAAKDNDFSFGVTMDWRGRMYYRSAYIQPQGSNFEKAAIIFKDSMPMSDQALAALRIGVANELGKDKLSLNGRIDYMKNEGWKIALEVAANPSIATISKYVELDKCFLALSGCIELVRVVRERVQKGSWEGVESAYVIHQDGTCNGIQHASALLSDRATAYAVNCTAASWDVEPQDIYGMVAHTAQSKLEHEGLDDLAAIITRKVCKKPVMVTGYGASEGTAREGAMAQIQKDGHELTETMQTAVWNAINGALHTHAAAVVQMTAMLNEQVTNWLMENDVNQLAWRTPDGMIIKQEYKDSSNKVILPTGIVISLTKLKPQVSLDIEKMARATSPNFVHSLDAAHLRAVVRGCEHELVAIHDSIGSHPATFFQTNDHIRNEFVEIHSNNPLSTLERWNNIKLAKTGDYDVSEVLESTYLFS